MRFKVPKQQPSSFKNSARYLAGLSHGKSPDRVDWMVANNMETTHPDAAAAIMEATANQSKRCKQPVYHFILTFDPKDAQQGKVSQELMQQVAQDTLSQMGLRDYQSLVYAHKDTDHPHIHFLINRIHPETGKAYSRHRDGTRLRDIVRDLAEQHGLNKLRSKDKVHERDLMDEQAGHLTDGQYRQANREADGTEKPFAKDKVKALRDTLKSAFYNAQSWQELEVKLAEQGFHLQQKGQGLIISNGEQFAKLSDMGKGVRLSSLEDRFGEKFETHRQADLKQRATESKAREKLDRSNFGDYAIKELDAADQEYRYWSMVEKEYLSRKSNITRSERQHKSAESNRDRQFSWTQWRNVELLLGLTNVYKDADHARFRWDALEQRHGLETSLEMIKADPTLLGGLIDAKGKRAKRDFRKLAALRRKYHTAKTRLDNAHAKIITQRRQLDKARYEYEVLCKSVGTLDQIKNSVRDKIKLRAIALSRVTAKMLREANLADERRLQLHKAWQRHHERNRAKERERGRGY